MNKEIEVIVYNSNFQDLPSDFKTVIKRIKNGSYQAKSNYSIKEKGKGEYQDLNPYSSVDEAYSRHIRYFIACTSGKSKSEYEWIKNKLDPINI